MYYIIFFFFWIHLFNAMSRFRAWSLKLPTIACSAPGFVSSCSEQEFLRLREDSDTGSGERARNQRGPETNRLWETGLVSNAILRVTRWAGAPADLGRRRVKLSHLGLVRLDALAQPLPNPILARFHGSPSLAAWHFLPVLVSSGCYNKIL